MSSQFHALQVGWGESFLLQIVTEERTWTFLVDSGYSAQKVTSEIRRIYPNLRHIDVCVCTHEDVDHSGGFALLASRWCVDGRTIGEYWLPGSWGVAVRGLLVDPDETVQKIVRGAVQCAEMWTDYLGGDSWEPRSDPETKREWMRSTHRKRVKEFRTLHLNSDSEVSVANSLGLTDEEAGQIKASHPASPAWLYHWLYGVAATPPNVVGARKMARASHHAIETADRLRAIAVNSLDHGIRVRWFDFNLFEEGQGPAGGLAELFRPINSVELQVPPFSDDPVVLFLSLKLSRQNVESLVFLKPENESEPAVLFLGDSRLAFGVESPTVDFIMPQSRPQRPIVVTAPHHGSSKNDYAYGVLQRWLGNDHQLYFARNGGHRKSKLGHFTALSNRVCAFCNQCTHVTSQPVELVAQNGNWIWPPTRGAVCP